VREEEVAVRSFLTSEDGQRYLAAILRRHRLPSALDADLETIVMSEAARTLAAGGEILAPVAWARQRAASRAVDLVRGRIRRPVTSLEELAEQAEPRPLDTDADEIDDRRPDAVRRRLLEVSPLWIAAAAVAVLARVVDGAPLVAECPQPKAGAGPVDAAHWAGLWYAGQVSLFPADGQPSSRALDQRRSRAVRAVKAGLAAAARDEDAGDG
jgi:hypothetical protein